MQRRELAGAVAEFVLQELDADAGLAKRVDLALVEHDVELHLAAGDILRRGDVVALGQQVGVLALRDERSVDVERQRRLLGPGDARPENEHGRSQGQAQQ